MWEVDVYVIYFVIICTYNYHIYNIKEREGMKESNKSIRMLN